MKTRINYQKSVEKIISLAMITLGIFLFWFCQAQAQEENYPKTANYYMPLSGVKEQDYAALAKYDIVVLPAEISYYFPKFNQNLKNLNKNMKILAYVPSQSFNVNWNDPLHNQMLGNLQYAWYLKDAQGRQVFFDNNKLKMMNVATPWVEYLSDFVTNNILKNRGYDGVFYDMVDDTISWLNVGNLDVNNDGKTDNAYSANASWLAGMEKLLYYTKAKNPGALIVINGTSQPSLRPYINGRMFEYFPTPWHQDGSWKASMKSYLDAHNDSVYQPPLFIINTNSYVSTDYKKMRFGLTSALLGNGYYSFDYGPQDHGQLWWYDEFDNNLGSAINGPLDLETAQSQIAEGVWMREFKKGIVVVNSTSTEQKIKFDAEYEKIRGKQDPVHNDGSIVNQISLGAKDGIILNKRVEDIIGANFDNGDFVRIFNKDGQVVRGGFFSYKKQYESSANIFIDDINGDGRLETVVAKKNKIYIYTDTGSLANGFYPYDNVYNGEINFVVGDVDNNGIKEIVTGTKQGGGAHIRIFSHTGRLLNPGFFAYAKTFRGGVSVAIGDIDGNGTNEIIAGAGYGGGPHVRIFNCNGKLLSPGFFAYSTGFRGGVNVAAGDVNGDGKDEIITTPGKGGSPQVKVFNGSGKLLYKDFYAFSASNISGISISCFDIDGNGQDEIVAQTADVFSL